MIAGVPGAGISAFFYLFAVLFMPFHAAWRTMRGQPVRWGLVWRQFAIGAGIVMGLVAGGAAVAAIAAGAAPTGTGQLGQLALEIGMTLGRIGIFLGLGTLALVMGSVQLFSLYEGLRTGSAKRAPASQRPVRVVAATMPGPWSTVPVHRKRGAPGVGEPLPERGQRYLRS
jgi:hypothetical protein